MLNSLNNLHQATSGLSRLLRYSCFYLTILTTTIGVFNRLTPANHIVSTLQTMNKVFQHAGDLVNLKVAHNLMRLIAEGFGEDDDTADCQLRLSAVCFLLNSCLL